MAKIYIKNTDGTYIQQPSTLVSNLDIVQDKGDSLTSAMSQKAVTDELKSKQDTINDLETIRSNAQNASDVVTSMTNAGYVFAGVATLSTNPGTPEAKVFYIANGKGTYTNFGGIEVMEDEVVVLYWDTAWHKGVTGIAPVDIVNTNRNVLGYISEHSRNIADSVVVMPNTFIATGGRISREAGCYSIYFPCLPNTTYSLSKTLTTRFRVATTTNIPAIPMVSTVIDTTASVTSKTFTTPENANYIVVWVLNSSGETKTIDDVLSSLQLEIGDHATPYVMPYSAKDYDARNSIKVLEDKVDGDVSVLSASDVVTGYYRTNLGVLISQTGNFYSKPIFLRNGDAVRTTDVMSLSSTYAVVCIVNDENAFLACVVAGASDVVEYVATEDCYVSVGSFSTNLNLWQIVRRGISVVLESTRVSADKVNDLSTIIIDTAVNKGYYRTYTGTLVSLGAYFYTMPIKAKRGDKVKSTIPFNVSSNVSLISKVDENGNFLSSLLIGSGVSEVVDYTINEDCYIEISYITSNLQYIKFVVGGIETDLVNVHKAISEIGDIILPDQNTLLPKMTTNPLALIRRDPGYGAIIRKWGIIGDSLSSGEMQCYDNTSTSALDYKFIDMYQYSWGQVFARLIGADAYNFSNGGQTTWGWLKKQGIVHDDSYIGGIGGGDWELAKQDAYKKDAYIIALGVNDRSKIASGEYVLGATSQIVSYDGTYSDIDDTSVNPKSFVRYYAGIIQRVKSIQPKAKIFCVTPLGSNYAEIAQAIRDIVEYYSSDGVYLIDLFNYIPEGYNVSGYMLNGHLSPMGYAYTAYMMNTYIDWIIRNNGSAFRDTALIGTEYRADY